MSSELRDRLVSPRTRAVGRLQMVVINAMRETLAREGYVEIQPPIIGPVTDPGIRGSKQVDVDFYGETYKLMTSAILYKQAHLLTHDRIFCVAPNVRLEPLDSANTSRHLAEFRQFDVEIADASSEDARQVVTSVMQAAVARALNDALPELSCLERDVDSLKRSLEEPVVITHSEAVDMLRARGLSQNETSEITWEGERYLTHDGGPAVFVVGYPKGSRGFYDVEREDDSTTLDNFDMLAPEGYGEICSGSRREHRPARLMERMRESGENPRKYAWYLDLSRDGLRPSAGFGLGIERLVRYIAGLKNVYEATPFPRVPGQVSA